MKRSEIVLRLADIASKGEYKVTPKGARVMNQVFELVANLVNELEAEEAAAEAAFADALKGEENVNEG